MSRKDPALSNEYFPESNPTDRKVTVTARGYYLKDMIVRFVRFEETNKYGVHYDTVVVRAAKREYDDKGKLIEPVEEVANIDLDTMQVWGPSTYWSGRRPRGVPAEFLGIIEEYLGDIEKEDDDE